MLKKSMLIISALGLLSTVSATSYAAGYQQCGGYNHNGPTNCERGYHCEKLNDYFHQCLPGEEPQSRSSTATSTAIFASMPVSMTTTTPTLISRSRATRVTTVPTSTASPSRTPSIPSHLMEFARRDQERRAAEVEDAEMVSMTTVVPMYPYPTQTLTAEDIDQINLLDEIEQEILRFSRNGGGFVIPGSLP